MVEDFDYKKLTATQDTWEFEVDGHKFTCEETTIGDEAEFFNYYVDPSGETNMARLRLVQLTKLKETPFTAEWIKHVFATFSSTTKIKHDITWEQMSSRMRLFFISKLDDKFVSKIIRYVGKHYTDKEELIKN